MGNFFYINTCGDFCYKNNNNFDDIINTEKPEIMHYYSYSIQRSVVVSVDDSLFSSSDDDSSEEYLVCSDSESLSIYERIKLI